MSLKKCILIELKVRIIEGQFIYLSKYPKRFYLILSLWKFKSFSISSILKKLLIFFSIILLTHSFMHCNLTTDTGYQNISNGYIDLDTHDFHKIPRVILSGEWEFYWSTFLIQDNKTIDFEPILINIPSSWTSIKHGDISLPSKGYASYKLTIKMNPYSKKMIYGIRIKDIGTAYKLYWNKNLILEKGRIGRTESEHFPAYESLIGDIFEIKDLNELVIEVSNYNHIRAGLWNEIEFGIKNELILKKEKSMLPNFFSVGALFIMSMYHLTIFSIRKKDYTGLFFGLFCFTVLFRPLTTEDKFLFILFNEIPWELSNKIEYLSLFTSSVLFNFFIYVLHKKEVSKYMIFIPSGLISLMILGIVFFNTYVFSNFVPYFEVLLLFQCLYVTYILLKRFFSREDSLLVSFIGFLGFFIFFITIINDVLKVQNLIRTDNLAHIGLIFFILSQSYILSVRISKTFSSVEQLSRYLKISNRKLISLKKNLESKVEERTKELLEKSSRIELVGRMTSIIVHDLKNPISSIIGFAELANDPTIGKEIRSGYLKTIEIEAYRLSDMSHDILDFVKGEFKIKKDMILIKNFIEEIQTFIYPDIKQYNISLSVKLGYIGIAYIDTDRMRRAILNIFSNSVDALISSSIKEPRFQISTSSDANFLTIELSDNGPGIPEQVLEKLFQPFVTYGKYNGTGLGMAQVKGIVEAHNGEVRYKTSNLGTTFFLLIPISNELKNEN